MPSCSDIRKYEAQLGKIELLIKMCILHAFYLIRKLRFCLYIEKYYRNLLSFTIFHTNRRRCYMYFRIDDFLIKKKAFTRNVNENVRKLWKSSDFWVVEKSKTALPPLPSQTIMSKTLAQKDLPLLQFWIDNFNSTLFLRKLVLDLLKPQEKKLVHPLFYKKPVSLKLVLSFFLSFFIRRMYDQIGQRTFAKVLGSKEIVESRNP